MGNTNEKLNNAVVDEKPESQVTKPITKPIMTSGARSPRTFESRQKTNGAGTNNTVALSNHFSGDLEDLEERVKSMMEKSQHNYANRNEKAFICRVCGKESAGNAIKDHIEVNHLEGIVIPCNLCEKTFSYRNGLRKHMRKDHQKYH